MVHAWLLTGEVLFEVLGGGFRDGYCDTANRMVPNASGIAGE